MYQRNKYKSQSFALPRLKTSNYGQKSQKSYSKFNNSLISYQDELLKNKMKIQYNVKPKKKVNRLKTLQINEHQPVNQIKRQLKSIKLSFDYKMNQYNNRIENKLLEYSGFLRKQSTNSSVVYQPMPMVLPYMFPPVNPMPPINPMNYNAYRTLPHDYGNYPYDNNEPYFPPQKKPKMPKSFYNRPVKLTRLIKNLRIRALAVIFTLRIKKFCQKIVRFKRQQFNKFMQKKELKQQANTLKKILIQGSKPFLLLMLQKQEYQLKLNDGDSENFKKQKILMTHKMIQNLIKCLQQTIDSPQFNNIIRLIYYFCRHGSFACLHTLLTLEQLQNLSLSQKHHYLQAQKNLQKSQIINFVFMKILIYNALGQAQKIDKEKFSKQREVLNQNILIITSIFYELLMMIQDNYIVNSPQCYKLGNYLNIKGIKIYPSQSLTVKPGQFRKNQVVSGLIHQNYLKKIYKLQKQWVKQSNQIEQLIQRIHQKIIEFHKEIMQQFF